MLVLQLAVVEHRFLLDLGIVIGSRSETESAHRLRAVARLQIAVGQMKAGILGQRVAPRGDLRQTLDRPVVLPVRIIAITGQIELLAAHRTAQLLVIVHISP